MKNIVIVGHPRREKKELYIDDKKYNISFDGFKSENHNEDPFIWNDNFFYTFCHTNHSLSKDVRDLINDKNEVYFVFVAWFNGDNSEERKNILEIDTIIKAKELFEWPEKGNRDTDLLREKFNTYHLPKFENGNLTEHNRKKLFTCIGDKEESFLPMKKYNDSYESYRLNEDISEKIRKLITVEGSNRYYVAKKTSPRFNKQEKKIFNEVSIDILKIIEECIEDKDLHLTGKKLKGQDKRG